MSKIYAIMGGGDWADASVDHIVFDQGYEGWFEKLVEDWKEYRQMRSDIMRINAMDGTRNPVPPWVNMSDWLLANGGRRPTKDELEEVWDE